MSDLVNGAVARQAEIDRALDSVTVDPALPDELWASARLLREQAALRRAVTDPGHSVEQRADLLRQILQGKVSDVALGVLQTAVRGRWSSGRDLVAAVERQAVRARWLQCLAAGSLDTVEEELFRFSRVVEASPELRDALGDRSTALQRRTALIADLLAPRADSSTVWFASHAAELRERTYQTTLEGYVDLAAQVRRRAVARVTVAVPLTPEQRTRLAQALSRQAGREVTVHEIVDPSVLGGVRVELGDDVVEGTVAAKLEAARRTLG